ncbi:MAG: HAMP domain-containing sensor histidine kinase [Thermodesulfobacteriota bacterium]
MTWTIFKRLTFGYLAIMAIPIFLCAFLILQLDELQDLTWRITSIDERAIRTTQHLMGSFLSQAGFERKYLVFGDTDFLIQFRESEKAFLRDLQRLGEIMDTPEKRAWYEEVKSRYGGYLLFFNRAAALRQLGQRTGEGNPGEEGERWAGEIQRNLEALMRASASAREDRMALAGRISTGAMTVTVVAASCAILIGLVVSVLNTGSIHRPILRLQEHTRAIAGGNLETISDISSPPEIRQLADDFNLMCERLRELDGMKQDFISHVSHQLRTPLAAIQSASGLLLEGIAAGSEEKRRELLGIIREESQRLIQEVNRILDISRMEAGMMEYRIGSGELQPLVQKMVLKLAPIAFRKGIDLELTPLPDLPSVAMDEERVAQVLENLIGNALKFTPRGGKVTVRTSCGEGDRSVRVSVSDTGRGIPRESLEKVFDKFKQVGPGKGRTGGTGLGLAIARWIITDHGGNIWAESEPGKGSTFTFTLPSA